MTERLLSARELADLLGFSAATVVDWAEAGKLPGFKIGGRLRFRLSEVEDWLEGCRVGRDVAPRDVKGATSHRPREVVR